MPSKPLLIFDGACGFCRRWIERWRQKTGDRIDYAPSQEAAGRFPEIPKEEFDRSVVLVEPNGAITTGAEAALKALALGSRRGPGDGGRILYWFYRRLPGFKTIAEKFYSFIASHRMAASRISNLLWGKNLEPSTYRCSIWIFLRLLGLTYLIAFLSLAVQIRGLVGKNGILPIAPLVDLVKERLGPWGILDFPTLCWFQAGDPFLLFLCLGGAALSLLVLFGFLQGPLLLILWIFYLSLATAGQVFLQFQWDNLLLEAGFIALCAAPWKVWAGKPATLCLSRPARWLFWFLLFKLTFSSGLVKLASGDETWQNLTALNFHYETQPLPTWIGWHVHQLPEWFQKVSVVFMFFVELVVPFFIFMPRRIRHGGAFLIMALQGLIALTGNYGFFNLLTIALCLTILDDVFWKRPAIAPLSPLSFSPQKTAALVFLALYSYTCTLQVVGIPSKHNPLYRKALSCVDWTIPFRTINRYGLFAVMTTTRPEIIIQGSNDEDNWKEYVFKWKAGNLKDPPRFVEPHMPRVDWQMWFAALGNYKTDRWILHFMGRLLAGSPEVLQLIKVNPFPDTPPRFVRALLYEYHFTDDTTKKSMGEWWRRELKGEYTPVMSFKE